MGQPDQRDLQELPVLLGLLELQVLLVQVQQDQRDRLVLPVRLDLPDLLGQPVQQVLLLLRF